MALAESTIEDKIEVVDCGGWKVIQVRTATIITKDGSEISRSFHRHLLTPIDDFSGESEDVQAIANRVFTEEAKAAYRTSLSEAP